MVVADASVWIDHFNEVPALYVDIFHRELLSGSIITTDVIIMEVLQGFRSDKEYAKAVEIMKNVRYFSFSGWRCMKQAASNYRLLRKRGITIRKPNDVVVATLCLEHGYSLIHNDHDFDYMETVLGLKVLKQ